MSSEPHPNAQLIARLYKAIQNADPDAIAACYADDAYFEDIAFRLRGRERIHGMWRYVCHSKPQVKFDLNDIAADDRKGSGRWRAKYMFGKTATKPGRPVDNTLSSEFVFKDGLIIDHRDQCDPRAWADQAFAFPANLLAGSIGPLRRRMAEKKLKSFLENPKS